MDQHLHQGQNQQPDRDVDKENPAPPYVVCDPAPDRGANGRRKDHGHAIDRKCYAAPGGWRGVCEDGLGIWLQPAACNALQSAKYHKRGKVWA